VGQACPRTGCIWIDGQYHGVELFQSRDYDEAICELRSDLAVHPEDASTYWFLGYALIAKHQPGQAIPVLEKALALSGPSPAVMGISVRAYAHAGHRWTHTKASIFFAEKAEEGLCPGCRLGERLFGTRRERAGISLAPKGL
jgi:hypothetical protein